MEKFVVKGLEEGLQGTVKISGSKNAVLPILAACLLTREVCEIRNVPPLSDVIHMTELLRELGAQVEFSEEQEMIRVCAETIESVESEYETARKMRASFLVAGALLGRCGHARLSLPGGCQIGSRPSSEGLSGVGGKKQAGIRLCGADGKNAEREQYLSGFSQCWRDGEHYAGGSAGEGLHSH